MDLRAIRVGLAAVAEDFGFTSYSFVHANPTPPAVVVGFPDVTYGASLKLAQVELAVTLVVSLGDDEARDTLTDTAFSTHAESLVDAYNGATNDAWRSCKVVSAGNYRTVILGTGQALVADIELELIA